jgi:hypothetical protein
MLALMAMRNYASFAPSGKSRRKKERKEKSASIAGARPMPPIRGRSGRRRPSRRWQMKALLG